MSHLSYSSPDTRTPRERGLHQPSCPCRECNTGAPRQVPAKRGRPRKGEVRPPKPAGRGRAWKQRHDVTAARIMDLRREHLTVDGIAARLNASRFLVHLRLRQAGLLREFNALSRVPVRGAQRDDITPAAVLAMFDGGMRIADIMAELDCSRKLVCNRLKEAREAKCSK